jgi:alkaline phosphatase
VIEFDNAVAVARRFADEAGETLIIVLADHECSGFSLIGALSGGLDKLKGLPADSAVTSADTQPERQKVVGTNFSSGGFPKYNILADGYPENFNVDGKMLVGFGASADRFERWLTRPLPGPDGLGAWDKAMGMFVRGQGLKSGNAPHGASDVPVSAYAYDELIHRRFVGTYENIDVYFRTMEAVGAGAR